MDKIPIHDKNATKEQLQEHKRMDYICKNNLSMHSLYVELMD